MAWRLQHTTVHRGRTVRWAKGSALLVALGLPSGAVAAPLPITTAQMASELQRLLWAIDGREIRFQAVHSYGEGATIPPRTGPTVENLVYRSECLSIWTANDNKLRFERHWLDAGSDLKGMIGDREVMTWDGREFRHFRRPAAPDSMAYAQIFAEPPPALRTEPHLSWLGAWVFQFRQAYAYHQLLSGAGVSGPELLDDGATRWSMPFPDWPTVKVVLEAERLANGEPRLRSAELQGYGSADAMTESNLAIVQHVTFHWNAGDPVAPLPTSAEVLIRLFRATPQESAWGLTQFKLDAVALARIEDDTFKAALSKPMQVADSRYDVSYELGSLILKLDGKHYRTSQPLVGNVGDNLEWWMANALEEPDDSPVSSKGQTSDRDHPE